MRENENDHQKKVIICDVCGREKDNLEKGWHQMKLDFCPLYDFCALCSKIAKAVHHLNPSFSNDQSYYRFRWLRASDEGTHATPSCQESKEKSSAPLAEYERACSEIESWLRTKAALLTEHAPPSPLSFRKIFLDVANDIQERKFLQKSDMEEPIREESL